MKFLGLKLWYVYNKRAIEQTHDLCRVTGSHRLIMTQPNIELARIHQGLLDCGVAVPHMVSKEDIAEFIDVKLQHGKTTLLDTSCDILKTGGEIHPPASWSTTNNEEIRIYREAIRVYCALEDQSAYSSSFKWDNSIKDE